MRVGFALLTPAFTYFAVSVVFSLIPVNHDQEPQNDIEIFIRSNGVHLDLVLPLKTDLKDWTKEIGIDPRIKNSARYISFGFGDKEFYENTPEWSDLTLRTAIVALFLKSPTAIHVNYFGWMETDRQCRRVKVSNQQYLAIVDYIETSFKRDSAGKLIRIPGLQYYRYDLFYEANHSFSLFFTCNSWTNRCLKKAGLRSCLWTPFDRGTLYQYRNKKYD